LQAAQYYDEATRNENDVRHASEIKIVAQRIQSDLQSLAPSGTSSQATSTFLHLLADESARYHVSVHSIVPSIVADSATGPFEKTEIELTLSGRFFDVLHFVAELPRRQSLIDIHDMSLSNADRRMSSPILTVTLHTTLYRLRGRVAKGVQHVASPV
jgi:hypothetical protein